MQLIGIESTGKKAFVTVAIVLFVNGFGLTLANAQVQPNGQLEQLTHISPTKLHYYLRQPDGIEKLSAEVGDVVLSEDEERWGEHTISSLTKGSDIIMFAAVRNAQGHLSEDGDSVLTKYDLEIIQTLKGSAPREPRLDVRGGTARLSNGHSVVIHTPIADAIQLGAQYIFFLKQDGDSLVAFGASQGIPPG